MKRARISDKVASDAGHTLSCPKSTRIEREEAAEILRIRRDQVQSPPQKRR
jgi:hypothetical protein